MDQAEIVTALDAYRRGTLAVGALARAIVGYPSWHVPARAASSDGQASVALVAGSGGQFWVCAFTSADSLGAFQGARRDSVPAGQLVVSGASLTEHLPKAAYGVGLDLGSPHAVALEPPAPSALQELGEAVEVEAVLAGRSERRDQFERLRRYRGYRIAWQGSSLLLAPDARGRRLAAVFTADDTLAAYATRHGAVIPAPQKVDGESLYELLRHAPLDGIVFNCAGPVPPKAVAHAFAAAVLAGVDPPGAPAPSTARSASPESPPAALGAGAAPAATVARDVISYRPRMVRQDCPELARGVVSRPLVSPSEPTEPIVSPMICLACDTPSGTLYATAKALGTRRLDELVTEGAEQLFAESPPALRLLGKAPGILCCLGPHAVESLLVPALVQALHEKLGSNELLAALPVRGVVIACGINNPIGLVRLSAMVKRAYRAAGASGLYEELVLLVGGKIVGRASIEVERKGGGEPLPEAQGQGGPGPRSPGAEAPAPKSPAPKSPAVEAPAPKSPAVEAPAPKSPAVEAPAPKSPAVEAPAPKPAAVEAPSPDRPSGRLRARSLAECGLYLDLCDCPLAGRRETIATAGDDVVVRYECTKPDGAEAHFEFCIRKTDMAATSGEGPIRYGAGPAPSLLIDAGQFFGLAEGFAKAGAGAPDGLDKSQGLVALEVIERAAACMDEVTKFIPEGQEMVPDSAFFTASGRAIRAAQPAGRFSRARLGAIGGAYRGIAQRFREHAHQEGWLYG